MGEKHYIQQARHETRYYSDEAMTVLHREGGPAIQCENGSKFWYVNGERHREDGPAIEGARGYDYWYLNDERVNEDGSPYRA